MGFPIRFLSGFLASAALAATPSLAQEVKVVNDNSPKPTLLRQAGNWSAEHEVISIVVYKGAKDEVNPKTGKPMTGEEIGNILAAKFAKDPYFAKTKVFVGEGGPDYTAISYGVKGHIYGDYDLQQAVTAIGLAAHDFKILWAGEKEISPAPTSTPEPKRK